MSTSRVSARSARTSGLGYAPRAGARSGEGPRRDAEERGIRMSDSLYQRLGGIKGISAAVSTAVDLHLKNPEIATRFRNTDIAKAKKLATQFFCVGSGGPEKYEGRGMRTTHQGMNINEREYMAAMDDILVALAQHKVGPRETAEVVAILYSLKGEILHV